MADQQHNTPGAGAEAPDFTLEGFVDGGISPVTLSSYRGKSNVVLAFYVLDWTRG